MISHLCCRISRVRRYEIWREMRGIVLVRHTLRLLLHDFGKMVLVSVDRRSASLLRQ